MTNIVKSKRDVQLSDSSHMQKVLTATASVYGHDAVDKVTASKSFRDSVNYAVDLVSEVYGIEHAKTQRYIMMVALHAYGVQEENIMTAARYLISSDHYASKARYKIPVTASDFVQALNISDPSWYERISATKQ